MWFLVSSSIVPAPSFAVVSSSAAVSAASAVASSASSAESSLFFVFLVADVVLRVYVFYRGFSEDFEASVSAYVQSYVASEEVYVAVFDVDCVAFFDFFDVLVPEV